MGVKKCQGPYDRNGKVRLQERFFVSLLFLRMEITVEEKNVLVEFCTKHSKSDKSYIRPMMS